jgi:hypothetical protein
MPEAESAPIRPVNPLRLRRAALDLTTITGYIRRAHTKALDCAAIF